MVCSNNGEGNGGNDDNDGNDDNGTQGKDWIRNPAVMDALLGVLGAPQAKNDSPGNEDSQVCGGD